MIDRRTNLPFEPTADKRTRKLSRRAKNGILPRLFYIPVFAFIRRLLKWNIAWV